MLAQHRNSSGTSCGNHHSSNVNCTSIAATILYASPYRLANRCPHPNHPATTSPSPASSYAQSITSSSFTLSSSTTDGSSTPRHHLTASPVMSQGPTTLSQPKPKKLYQDISALETKILRDDADDDPGESRTVLRPPGS